MSKLAINAMKSEKLFYNTSDKHIFISPSMNYLIIRVEAGVMK